MHLSLSTSLNIFVNPSPGYLRKSIRLPFYHKYALKMRNKINQKIYIDNCINANSLLLLIDTVQAISSKQVLEFSIQFKPVCYDLLNLWLFLWGHLRHIFVAW